MESINIAQQRVDINIHIYRGVHGCLSNYKTNVAMFTQ